MMEFGSKLELKKWKRERGKYHFSSCCSNANKGEFLRGEKIRGTFLFGISLIALGETKVDNEKRKKEREV